MPPSSSTSLSVVKSVTLGAEAAGEVKVEVEGDALDAVLVVERLMDTGWASELDTLITAQGRGEVTSDAINLLSPLPDCERGAEL